MTITAFSGKYRFLSNFWLTQVTWAEHTYPSVEHAYQAAKTLNQKERTLIRNTPNPGHAKRLGRRITMRLGWNGMRISVMHKLLKRKFEPDTFLAKQLIATYPHDIIEGNSWGDTFWGESPLGTGENHLGHLLMTIREELL